MFIIKLILRTITQNSGSIPRNACVACETALDSVTEKCDRRTDRRTDRQTDEVIPMYRYASQATLKW